MTQDQNPSGNGLFDAEMLKQLHAVFERMESPLLLKLCLDERDVSNELRTYMEELTALTEKLSVEITNEKSEESPCVYVYKADGTPTGLAFHGVPGGHEFTSFVLGLYNAAGTGQALDAGVLEKIQRIDCHIDMKILVSLSCTMCPDLVVAAQKMASLNKKITAEVFDLNHFPNLRDKYHVMSVPCLVINDGEQISFGKKNILQLLEIIDSL